MIKLVNSPLQLVSWLGDNPQMFFLITTFVGILFITKLRREAFWLAVSGVGSFVLSSSIKILVHEPRPLFSHLSDWSFPSGHVLSFVACFGFVAYVIYTRFNNSIVRNILLFLLITITILIGISRVYLGEHWVIDVMGAYIIGGVWLGLIIQLSRHLYGVPENSGTKF